MNTGKSGITSPKTHTAKWTAGQSFTTHQLVMMALFAALTCVSAYISIPLPTGSHLSLLNAMILIIIFTFPLRQSFFTILVWFLLGAFGLPVFAAGAAGFGYLFSFLGGYSFSFLLVAILIPLLAGKKYNRIYYTILAILAVIMIDAVGSIWWMTANHLKLSEAFAVGFVPFIPLDLVKAIAIAQIVPQVRTITNYYPPQNE